MDKKSPIYTRKGDLGTTQLCDGGTVSKSSAAVVACGEIDELNSFLGLAKTHIKQNKELQPIIDNLHRIQKELTNVNASPMTANSVTQLEQEIDKMNANLPSITNFVIPGVNKASAHLHIARAVCRRVERQVVALTTNISPTMLSYLNRLGDWLFILARFMENF